MSTRPDGILQIQELLSVYGDGPFDQDLGRTAGCEDVATLRIEGDFALVRKSQLVALLEELHEVAKRFIVVNDEPQYGGVHILAMQTEIVINALRKP